MPPRTASPGVSRSSKEHAEIVRRMQQGQKTRKEMAEVMQKSKEEEREKEKEWEDSMVSYVEYIFNGIVCLIAASLPASEAEPDYLTAGVVIVLNIVMNLMFRSTMLDRFILYTTNLLLPASGPMIHRMDEIPGQMPPIYWLVFFTSNSLLLVLGWWYYIRKCKNIEYEYRQNVYGTFVIAVNVTVAVIVGAISPYTVLRWLDMLKNIILHWTVA